MEDDFRYGSGYDARLGRGVLVLVPGLRRGRPGVERGAPAGVHSLHAALAAACAHAALHAYSGIGSIGR